MFMDRRQSSAATAKLNKRERWYYKIALNTAGPYGVEVMLSHTSRSSAAGEKFSSFQHEHKIGGSEIGQMVATFADGEKHSMLVRVPALGRFA